MAAQLTPKPTETQGASVIDCVNCQTENKAKSKNCKKCGWDLSLPPVWMPTWRWHAKVLGIITLGVFVLYFVANLLLSQLPPPFAIRKLPSEITPWLNR